MKFYIHEETKNELLKTIEDLNQEIRTLKYEKLPTQEKEATIKRDLYVEMLKNSEIIPWQETVYVFSSDEKPLGIGVRTREEAQKFIKARAEHARHYEKVRVFNNTDLAIAYKLKVINYKK